MILLAMRKGKVSETVIRRLPKYYRYLIELDDRGEDRISSQELSDLTGFTASQIRQDLNNFGGFGQQGYGYKVAVLKTELENINTLTEQCIPVLLSEQRSVEESELLFADGYLMQVDL